MERSTTDVKGFYSLLGVDHNSETSEIRAAYRKLAMKWHPDKCVDQQGDAREQAKLNFQAIQEAYSVLSDESKRLFYDAGLYDQADDEYGMPDFLGELGSMMKEVSSASNANNADAEFEDLRKLFMSIIDTDSYTRNCQQFESTHFDSSQVRSRFAVPSPTKVKPQVRSPEATNFCTQSFCMGVSSNVPVRDYRSHAKSTKTRKRPCKEKVKSTSSSWCELCHDKSGLGCYFCNSSMTLDEATSCVLA